MNRPECTYCQRTVSLGVPMCNGRSCFTCCLDYPDDLGNGEAEHLANLDKQWNQLWKLKILE